MDLKLNHRQRNEVYLVLQIEQTQAFASCISNGWDVLRIFGGGGKNDQVLDIFNGMAYGFKGSYAQTDCAIYTATFTDSLKDVGTAVIEIFSNGTLVTPFYRGQTAVVALSNVNTACQTTAVASQLNIRFNTASGQADLAYTLYNVVKEGFFDGLYDDEITNAVWSNSYHLWQGSVGRHSMSCEAVGFFAGAIIQALINFQIPDSIETGNVNGGSIPDI